MPKIHHVRAAQDYPKIGVKKGEMYYHWSFFRGPKQMSKERPPRSATTAAPTLSAAYAAEESLQDALEAIRSQAPQAPDELPDDPAEDVRLALEEAAGDPEGVIDQFEEKIENLQQAFQGGCPAIDEAEEQRDMFQAWLDELDSAASEIEGLDDEDYKDEDDPQQAKLGAALDIASNVNLDL